MAATNLPDSTPQRIGIAVVHCQARYLVGVRANDAVLGGFAEFPGGKARAVETIKETVVRECLEETGIAIQIERLLTTTRHQYPHGDLELAFFLCSPVDAECGAATGNFRWVEKWSLATLRFPPANAEVLRLLAEIDE